LRIFAAFAPALFFVLAFAGPGAAATVQPCLAPGAWYTLGDASPLRATAHDVLSDMAKRDVVLLGENHDDADHHRWQLQTLAGLHVLRPRMVIGFEAFPRRVQPVLDRWVAGELSARDLLARVEWDKVWAFPPELYLPLFEFARLNRIPMLALNVERTLTAAIREQGWDAIPGERKEGISRPAAAAPAYVDHLFQVFRQHAPHKGGAGASRGEPAFRFFVEAQTAWDRAFAQGLASPLKGDAALRPLVVGVIGAGHVRGGHGVTHQLRDLGVSNVGAMLPIDALADCGKLAPELADALFALPAATRAKAPPPRLGVQLDAVDGAIRVSAVTAGSLAERSGIKADDRIVSVAGSRVSTAGAVAAAIRSAPAGTWLPLEIRRGENTLELVVKFPPKS